MRSALMAGNPGEILAANSFPVENLIMNPGRYTYEGNWLFCSFPGCEIRAARLGFGQGGFRWEDYGLEPAAGSGIPFAYRLELITPTGVEACLLSTEYPAHPVVSSPERIDIAFRQNGTDLFRIAGWPRMRWLFGSPDNGMSAELEVTAESVTVWPDCVMPHNTFSMAIGTCRIEGVFRRNGGETPVSGSGFYDHPRVLVEDNRDAPPFGWYLYAPVSFADGCTLAGYHAEDGTGRCDAQYSRAFFTAPGGIRRWLDRLRVRNLRFDADGLPCGWEMDAEGAGAGIHCAVHAEPLACIRPSTRYLAFPILMSVEGELVEGASRVPLQQGSGIAEFLVRKGYEPNYP